jgi:hypothetical protein
MCVRATASNREAPSIGKCGNTMRFMLPVLPREQTNDFDVASFRSLDVTAQSTRWRPAPVAAPFCHRRTCPRRRGSDRRHSRALASPSIVTAASVVSSNDVRLRIPIRYTLAACCASVAGDSAIDQTLRITPSANTVLRGTLIPRPRVQNRQENVTRCRKGVKERARHAHNR